MPLESGTLQQMFKNNMAGNLAVDTNGDGNRNSVRLVEILNDAVLGKCDAVDGVSVTESSMILSVAVSIRQ